MRIAVYQMSAAAGDVAGNLDRLERAAADASRGGAALLVAPELATTGYGVGEAVRDLAEPLDGPSSDRLSAAARDAGITIVTGFAECRGDAVRNVALVLGPDGSRRAYAKRQLYSEYEKPLFQAGTEPPPLLEIRGWRLGVLICFDAEFPEHVRALARAGAQLIAVPTALPHEGSADFVATHVLPVRAFENQIFIAYADHAGFDGRFRYAGRSCIVAPDGGELARAGREPDMIFADLDNAAYEESRRANPYLQELPG